ncbi:hypothetical protein VVD49_02960 [Uliginosibacterium sp. H3]|uniref:Integral membrane plasmid transfer protein n=1 Tax=Uliginosibacterium silvisoli TaxID=3114758 RepID=A0ABU6JZ18_9RHOO|nr:hypothetical protein [Uliginosibacterium sp. H3]
MQPHSSTRLSDAERMACATTAAFLRSVLGLRPMSLGVAALSFAGLYLCSGATVTLLFLGCFLATVPVLYLLFRVELDAGLFERLAAPEAGEEPLPSMDLALLKLGLLKAVAPRPLDDRLRGTRRLALRTLSLIAAQLVVLCVAVIVVASMK